MAGKYGEHNKVRCSFCNKSEDQVRKLIAGPEGVYICDECIEICAEIMDEELAYIKPAKLLALTTYRLLCDQAKEAKKICREFKPVFNKETYCQYIRDNFHENE